MISLPDMVATRSVSPVGADVLRAIGAAGRSFLVYARPRNAGKTTLTQAVLAEVPTSVPRQDFFGTERETRSLSAATERGYLVVGEIGHRGRPGYLAGDEVGRAFRLLGHGYTLASSLHADTVDEVFDVLRRNGITAEAAAAVPFLIKVGVLGDPDSPSTLRVVETVYEVSGIDGERPVATMLYERDGRSAATPGR